MAYASGCGPRAIWALLEVYNWAGCTKPYFNETVANNFFELPGSFWNSISVSHCRVEGILSLYIRNVTYSAL